METRIATEKDWEKLYVFFKKIYRENHPLHQFEFWNWQYGDEKHGRSIVSIDEDGNITGHVGAAFGGGYAWIINVFLDESCRGKGVLRKLYAIARNYYPLAATAANEAGLGLYRNMRWYRYHDLVRYVKLNPNVNEEKNTLNFCKHIEVNIDTYKYKGSRYFEQPQLTGIKLNSGSTAVCQANVGGLRFVDLLDIEKAEEEAWSLGYLWIDFITSWNDLKVNELERNNWVLDYKSIIPWRLNPIEENYFCDITFLSEEPIPSDFIVHRSFSDHGRIGSIKK